MADSTSDAAVMFKRLSVKNVPLCGTILRGRSTQFVNTVVKFLRITEAPATFALTSRMPIQVCGLQPIMEMNKAKLQLGLSQSSSFTLRRSCEEFVVMLNSKP